jgi:pimeloyl-ACP methyl ester carboxylesterase
LHESAGRLLVLHGAGSRGASHAAFVAAAVSRGFETVAPDLPGHGDESPLSEGVLHWVIAQIEPDTALRGSSLGAFLALQTAAADERVAAVVALAPTTEQLILERYPEWPARVDGPSLEAWLRGRDVLAAAAKIACPVLYVHARDDERIPPEISERLHDLTPCSELVVLDSGGHSGPAHDPTVHELTLDWLERVMPATCQPGGP